MGRIHPGADPVRHLRLQEVEVLGLAHFEILRAGNLRIGLLEIGRLEQAAAIVALVAAGALEAAMGTGALDIAVRQETVVVDREDLVLDSLLDQPLLLEHLGEMLGQGDVRRIRGAAEHVIAQREALAGAFLDVVLLVAIGAHIHARGCRRKLGRRAVLIGGADIEDLMAHQPLETRIHVGRKHRTGEISQMLDAIDVGQSAGDQYTGHFDFLLSRGNRSRVFASRASRTELAIGP